MQDHYKMLLDYYSGDREGFGKLITVETAINNDCGLDKDSVSCSEIFHAFRLA
jgi:hypothetical protein